MAPSLLLQRGAGCSPAPVAAAAANASPGHSKVFPGCHWNRLVESMPGKCPTWHFQHMKPNTSSGETNEPRETSNLLAVQVKFTHALLEIEVTVGRYLLLEASCYPIYLFICTCHIFLKQLSSGSPDLPPVAGTHPGCLPAKVPPATLGSVLLHWECSLQWPWLPNRGFRMIRSSTPMFGPKFRWVRDADHVSIWFPTRGRLWKGFRGHGGHGGSSLNMPGWFRPSDTNNDVEDAKSG